jgi:hypothetical protein
MKLRIIRSFYFDICRRTNQYKKRPLMYIMYMKPCDIERKNDIRERKTSYTFRSKRTLILLLLEYRARPPLGLCRIAVPTQFEMLVRVACMAPLATSTQKGPSQHPHHQFFPRRLVDSILRFRAISPPWSIFRKCYGLPVTRKKM